MTHTAQVLSIMISFLSQRKRSGSSHHVYRETIHGWQRTGTAPWQLVLSTKWNLPPGQSQVSREGQWLVHQFDIPDSGCWEWEGVAWLYTVKFVCSMNFHRFFVLSISLHSIIKKNPHQCVFSQQYFFFARNDSISFRYLLKMVW